MITGSLRTMLRRARALDRQGRAPSSASAIDALRIRGVQFVAAMGWASLTVLLIANLWIENSSSFPLLAVGVAANIAPTLMALRRRGDAEARSIAGTLAAIMPALLVYTLRDHAWQMDAHMYFFVALAALTVLCDWKPIAVASGLIAAHHLLFEFAAPDWVFSDAGNIGRVIFHAVAVILQFTILAVITVRLERLFAHQDAAMAKGRRLIAAADAERRRAAEALEAAGRAEQDAATARRERKAAQERYTAERDAEQRRLADEFERTVAMVVQSIENAASQLAGSSKHLTDVAGKAGEEADDVAASAVEATGEIRQVAESLRNLSGSVSTIAATAQQQGASTRSAYEEGRQSVEMIGRLLSRADRISDFVSTIKSIAHKTNMLALNASIEAARAGETGRGFAVVATEVKNLASEAARASDEIATLLGSVRGAVAELAAGVGSVTVSVREVADGADGIAAAVEDQRSHATTIEDSASRAATNADAIERRIGEVASAVVTAFTLSTAVRESAGALWTDAGRLRSSTDRFVQFLRTT